MCLGRVENFDRGFIVNIEIVFVFSKTTAMLFLD